MTAYEETVFDKDGSTRAVFPASSQVVWAEHVFQFVDVLKAESSKFQLHDGYPYEDGYIEAVECLTEHFKEIFGVEIK